MKAISRGRHSRVALITLAVWLIVPLASYAQAPASSGSDQSGASKPRTAERDTAATYNFKGVEAYKAGRNAEAEAWFRKASQELWAQPDQVYALSKVLSNLSIVLKSEGKTEEFEKVKRQSDDLLEKFVDPATTAKLPARTVEEIGPNAAVRSMMQQMLVGLREAAAGKTNTINIYVPPQLETTSKPATGSTESAAEVSDAQRLNEEGIKAFRERNYTEAEQLYARGIALARGKKGQERVLSSLYHNLGELYEAVGNKERLEWARQMERSLGSTAASPPAAAADSPITETDAKNWAVLMERGLRLKGVGNYTEAEQVLQAAMKIAERFPENDMRFAATCNGLAGVYLQTDRSVQAEELYNRSLPVIEKAAGPDSIPVANTLDNIASTLTSQLKFSEAEAVQKRAMAIYEKHPGAGDKDLGVCLSHLAYVESKLGRRDEAEAHYQRALELIKRSAGDQSASYAVALDELGLLYMEGREYSKAESLFGQAFPIFQKALGPRHPEVATCLINRGAALWAMGKLSEAEPAYKEALDIQKTAFGPLSAKAASTAKTYSSLLRQLHRDAEADQVDKVVSVGGIATDAKLKSDSEIQSEANPAAGFAMRGLQRIQSRELDKAMDDFNRAAALNPNLSFVYGSRSLIHIHRGDYQAALKDLNRSLELDSHSAPSYRNRGHVYCRLKEYDKALKDLNEAVRLDPKFKTVYAYRGEAYLGLKDYERAVEDLSRSLALIPGDPNVLKMRGKAYEALGKKDLAAADFNAANAVGR